MESIKDYIDELTRQLNKLLTEPERETITDISNIIRDSNTIFICGNGGSAATAAHMVNDLIMQCGKRAYCLSDNTPTLTAYANDEKYDFVFNRQLQILANRFDTLIVITGSGNSQNILDVVFDALSMNMSVIAFVGMDGGKLLKLYGDKINYIYFKNADMQQSEDLHLIISHILTQMVRNE
jgi:D-sedoheptulose 7-phosphate isomerase